MSKDKIQSFKVGSQTFQVFKIDALEQFDVLCLVAPILAGVMPAIQDLAKMQNKKVSEDEKLEGFAKVMGPFLEGLAKLSKPQRREVLLGLCSCGEVQMPQGNWAKLVVGGNLMFSDMGLPVLMQVAGRAFMHNFQDFFLGFQPSL